jgi:tellurite resistance protein
MDTATITTPVAWRQLDYLPIGFFGSVMGLTGLSVAWRLAHALFGIPVWIADAIGALAVLTFVALSLGYAVKIATAFDAVRAEFKHPIAGNLFGTFLISLMLVPILLAPVALLLAQVMWVVGTVGMVIFAWFVVSRWMSDRQQIAHATPAWIIPVVGLLDVPLAVPALGFTGLYDVMIFGLALGLFFAIPLFTLIFSRLVFEPPMPETLLPSLLILVAPFAVGFSTYVATVGHIDLFASCLYMLTLFLLAVLLSRLRYLVGCCPFRVSWWAVSFPLAASAIAGLRYATTRQTWVFDAIAVLLLALATIVIAGLFVRTVYGVARGELRTLSG